MNKLIENSIAHDNFYISSALSEISGRLKGQAISLADENLERLDKKYFSEKIAEIANDVTAIWEYLHSINHPSISLK